MKDISSIKVDSRRWFVEENDGDGYKVRRYHNDNASATADTIVVNEITAYDGYFCAYVSLEEGEPAHKIARQSRTDLPVDVHGGFTYGCDKLPHPESVEGDYWVGWDYAHSFSEDPDLEEVVSEAKTVAENLGLVTLKQAAREKLSIEPDWYKTGLRQLYK